MNFDTTLSNLSIKLDKLILTKSNENISHGAFDEIIAFLSKHKLKQHVGDRQIKELENILSTCLNRTRTDDILPALKTCQVASHTFRIPGFTLSPSLAERFLEWILQVIENSSEEFVGDVLATLAEALSISSVKLAKNLNILMGNDGLLWRLKTADCSSNIELHVLDAVCNFSQCPVDPEYNNICPEVLANCMKVSLQALEELTKVERADTNKCKVAILSICTIENLLFRFHSEWNSELGKILGYLKAYMFFGLPGHNLSSVPLIPASLPQIEVAPQKESIIKTPKLKKKRMKTLTTRDIDDYDSDSHKGLPKADTELTWRSAKNLSSSDSEVSDSESARKTRERELQAKVRAAALSAVNTFLKNCDRRLVYAYWAAFLPDSVQGPGQNRSLITPILKDPSTKVRCAASSTMATALQIGQPILATASDEERRSTAFIPLSRSLAEMAVTVHRSLLLALAAEQSTPAVLQLLKCLGTAASVLPFAKLPQGLVSKTVTQCMVYLDHKEMDVRVACLSLFRIVASCHASARETNESLTRDADSRPATLAISSPKRCWLIERCLAVSSPPVLENCSQHSPLRLEGILALGEIGKENLVLAYPHMGDIVDVLCSNLKQNFDPLLQVKAAKSLTLVFSSIQQEALKEEQPEGSPLVSRDQAVALWSRLLKNGLPEALQDERNPALRTEACSLLATLGSASFECLTRELRVLCVTLLLGSAADSDAAVRAAAIRAIGFAVSYNTLNEDPAFLTDASELILSLLNDTNPIVSLNASWALGNLADVIDKNMNALHDELAASFIWNLISAATSSAQGPVKVRVNAVRALGNLLKNVQDLPEPHSTQEKCLNSAITALVKNITTGNLMKNRWNACYATGNVFRNTRLVKSSSWTTVLIEALTSTVANCKNFKVRIAAATSLPLVTDRDVWGVNLIKCWGVLVSSLGNPDQSIAFSEYQHQESLTQQICFTLSKMVLCVRVDDLEPLCELTTGYYELAVKSFEKTLRTLLPEKMECFVDAKEKLERLKTSALNSTRREAVDMFLKLYEPLHFSADSFSAL